jgi:hypothetical protein
VIAAWTAVLAALARAAYRRGTERIDIERHLTDKEFSAGLTARAVGRMRASQRLPAGRAAGAQVRLLLLHTEAVLRTNRLAPETIRMRVDPLTIG